MREGGSGRPHRSSYEVAKMVSTMFVHFNRTVIAPVWLVVFGLLALLWSPLSVAMGVVLLLVGLAGPAVMILTLWSDPSVKVARAVPPGEGSVRAR
jgi:hypothetical protein